MQSVMQSVMISSPIVPQIQTALNAGMGNSTQNRWNIPSARQEANSEILRNTSSIDNSRSKPTRDRPNDGPTNSHVYDSKCMGLVFARGQNFLRKLDFAENGNLGNNNHLLSKTSHFSQIWRHIHFS